MKLKTLSLISYAFKVIMQGTNTKLKFQTKTSSENSLISRKKNYAGHKT